MQSHGRSRLRTLTIASAAALLTAGGLITAGTTARDALGVSHALIPVSDADQLKAALAAARPGHTIRLADGTYRGSFKITAPGTSASRITLTGSPKAVLTARDGYGLRLDGASYWTVKGITVCGVREGIKIDSAESVTVDSVSVTVQRHA